MHVRLHLLCAHAVLCVRFCILVAIYVSFYIFLLFYYLPSCHRALIPIEIANHFSSSRRPSSTDVVRAHTMAMWCKRWEKLPPASAHTHTNIHTPKPMCVYPFRGRHPHTIFLPSPVSYLALLPSLYWCLFLFVWINCFCTEPWHEVIYIHSIILFIRFRSSVCGALSRMLSFRRNFCVLS